MAHLACSAFLAGFVITACTCSRDDATTGSKVAVPKPSAAAVQSWTGCQASGNANLLIVACAPPRAVTRARLPQMTDVIFDMNATRSFERTLRTNRVATREPLTLKNGRKVLAERLAEPVTDRTGRTTTVHMYAVGVPLGDGSGYFITCTATDDAICLADVDAIYADPPTPTRPLESLMGRGDSG